VLTCYRRTFAPLGNKDQIMEKLAEVAAELEKDMEEHGWTGRTVTLKYKLDTYQGMINIHGAPSGVLNLSQSSPALRRLTIGSPRRRNSLLYVRASFLVPFYSFDENDVPGRKRVDSY